MPALHGIAEGLYIRSFRCATWRCAGDRQPRSEGGGPRPVRAGGRSTDGGLQGSPPGVAAALIGGPPRACSIPISSIRPKT